MPIVGEALGDIEEQPTSLLTYEVWTPLTDYNHVEDITPVMSRKVKAIRSYGSQLKAFRYDRAVRGLNQYRGVLAARSTYAEVFGSAELASTTG